MISPTGRYKWICVFDYGMTMAVMFAIIFYSVSTPFTWGFWAITPADLGMGAIPTLNTLVAQYSVPKRLLGVSTGALFFSAMIGQVLAPAILGSAMNMKYNSALEAGLPLEVSRLADQVTMTSLAIPACSCRSPRWRRSGPLLILRTPADRGS